MNICRTSLCISIQKCASLSSLGLSPSDNGMKPKPYSTGLETDVRVRWQLSLSSAVQRSAAPRPQLCFCFSTQLQVVKKDSPPPPAYSA